MPNIIIRNWEHFNTALPNWNSPKGRYIRTKDEYDRACKEAGMISYDEMQRRVESNKNKRTEYKPSEKALAIMRHAMDHADKKGNVKLSGRAIEGLKEMKALKPKIPSYMQLPSAYSGKGGFNNGK